MPSRFDRLLEWLEADRENLPNRLTLGMGTLIRQAREEAGISQAELARRIYRRQASLSNIENGLMEASASTLVYLSGALGKPISYFFPESIVRELEPEPMSTELKELMIQAQRLAPDDVGGLAAQARALADRHRTRKAKATRRPQT
jgi:transcriptional regulator with XRE-family HTH domain